MSSASDTLLTATPIESSSFAHFGEVIDTAGTPSTFINGGRCARYTDLAQLDAVDGRIGLSLFQSEICALPYRCDLLERHPLGSQCFVPLGGSAYLLAVAEDRGGVPGPVQAFLAAPDQIVNLFRNTWHGVLAPISGSGLFAVLDRIGSGPNLQEHRLVTPVLITPPPDWAISTRQGRSHD